MTELIQQLRQMALSGLPHMYLPKEQMFVFRLKRGPGGLISEGISRRYTGTVLIGLTTEDPVSASDVLHGHNPMDVADHLLQETEDSSDLGEVALTAWALRALRHSRAAQAVSRLRVLAPAERAYPTVEVAWALSALTIEGSPATDRSLADALARRLRDSQAPGQSLFPHWPSQADRPWFRAHVACFADMVYPIQALSHHYRSTGDGRSLASARRCAECICRLQGHRGQWWWHYDVRGGQVLEPFPVYSVHQDSMAPMALAALRVAGGEDHTAAVWRGLEWLVRPPEIAGSLIDLDAGIIWRKVARREPARLARRLQAAASRLHPALRVPGIDLLCPPGWVDYETRPYHLGWILHAWPAKVADEPLPTLRAAGPRHAELAGHAAEAHSGGRAV